MLIIAGKIYVAPEKRDAYVSQSKEFLRSTREEPGLLDMIIAVDPLEEGRINIFELWASKEQMDGFRARAQSPQIDIKITRDEVKRYDISASSPAFS